MSQVSDNLSSSGPSRVDYQEFGLFHENAAEFGLVLPPPVVRRETLPSGSGLELSALIWGQQDPEIVLIHGGAQNAHTWDTVALALQRPLVAIDLPGHGHSAWREDGRYDPETLAADIAEPISQWAPHARVVVGMSLGGLTAMTLAAHRPDLVRSLVMVDITPGVNQTKAKAVIDFVTGPQSFASFEDLLARTIEHNPTRSESSLRRGILHNARQLPDGSWQWRYDRRGHTRPEAGSPADEPADGMAQQVSPLWERFSAVQAPLLLVQGGISPVVDTDDIIEAKQRQPAMTHLVVDGAGHSIQGDRPVELAQIISDLLG
jgi:pimeloyl-ACP methyl ester carboxylesterase